MELFVFAWSRVRSGSFFGAGGLVGGYFETINENPLKITIEANPNVADDYEPFFVTVNGKRLKNVKRFYLDWDRKELHKKSQCGLSTMTQIIPFGFGVEYAWDIEDEKFSTVEHIE